MIRAQLDMSNRAVFAHGLRNTVGFGWHPDTQELWGMDHGTDMRGDDIPPEELNRISEGLHYGWPYVYGDREFDYVTGEPEDTSFEEFAAQTEPPVLLYQAHAAPMAMVFYRGSNFPASYQGDAFMVMRGSWNRHTPVGYKVVRLRFEDGQPQGFEDFITGFLNDDGNVHFGRLSGIALDNQGRLLFSDDENGVIYRVGYQPKAASN